MAIYFHNLSVKNKLKQSYGVGSDGNGVLSGFLNLNHFIGGLSPPTLSI